MRISFNDGEKFCEALRELIPTTLRKSVFVSVTGGRDRANRYVVTGFKITVYPKHLGLPPIEKTGAIDDVSRWLEGFLAGITYWGQ